MLSDADMRTFDQIKRYYEIEKKLANRLRRATQSERQQLYVEVYDEFRTTLANDSSAPSNDLTLQAGRTRSQMKFLRRFLYPEAVFLELGSSSCRTAIGRRRL